MCDDFFLIHPGVKHLLLQALVRTAWPQVATVRKVNTPRHHGCAAQKKRAQTARATGCHRLTTHNRLLPWGPRIFRREHLICRVISTIQKILQTLFMVMKIPPSLSFDTFPNWRMTAPWLVEAWAFLLDWLLLHARDQSPEPFLLMQWLRMAVFNGSAMKWWFCLFAASWILWYAPVYLLQVGMVGFLCRYRLHAVFKFLLLVEDKHIQN